MRFDIVTIFPEFFAGPLDYGIVRRARETGLVEAHVSDLREFTHDRHRTVDDRPFGGGEGMLLKPEPLFEAVEALLGHEAGAAAERAPREPQTAVVLLSAAGRIFHQGTARRLAQLDRVILLCGRYEGVDERVAQHLASEEISIGDFVLSGGELAAAVVLDAVTRLLPGALGNEASSVHESFSNPQDEEGVGSQVQANQPQANQARAAGVVAEPAAVSTRAGILDCPHYTRPAEFRGWTVPDVLIGGHHQEIRRWRRRAALEKTLRNRPELLRDAPLSADERVWLAQLAKAPSA
jgi:tRNA (guanine37-N1)-methyltransferase